MSSRVVSCVVSPRLALHFISSPSNDTNHYITSSYVAAPEYSSHSHRYGYGYAHAHTYTYADADADADAA